MRVTRIRQLKERKEHKSQDRWVVESLVSVLDDQVPQSTQNTTT